MALHEKRGLPQDLQTRDAANRGVSVWKMKADVAFANRAEDRVRDGMRKDIRIAVPIEAETMGNLHAAEDQCAPSGKAMHVVADAGDCHAAGIVCEEARGVLNIECQSSAGSANANFLGRVFSRRHFESSAGTLNEELASGDVPETHAGFDVGVEPPAGDIS